MKRHDMESQKRRVPLWQKYALTINEATEYFNIGEKKLRRLVDDHPDQGFYVMNGTKMLIKRKQFEEFMDQISAV